MRLVHPIISPFVVVPFWSLTNRTHFFSLAMLSTLVGTTFSRQRIQLLEQYPSQMVHKLGA